jgi:hypothetical protein
MGDGFNAELKVPDLWYDFYARLLPGTAFVGCVRFFVFGKNGVASTIEALAILGIGYFSAMLTQPLASELTLGIHWLTERLHGIPAPFIRKL